MAIDPRAIVHPAARLAPDVEIAAFCVIHADVELSQGVRVGAFCEIGVSPAAQNGRPVTIGSGSLIRSHSIIYAGSTFGDQLETGHRVTLREGIRCGTGVRIGTLSDVQGDCDIGDFARLHSSVFVAQGSRIGRCAWLSPRVVLTNDPTPPSETVRGCRIEPYAVVAACAVVLPGVVVGEGALVAAHACVTDDVPPGMVVQGNPARISGRAAEIALRDRDGPAYPWRRHFHRGYPPELVREWLCEPKEDEQGAA